MGTEHLVCAVRVRPNTQSRRTVVYTELCLYLCGRSFYRAGMGIGTALCTVERTDRGLCPRGLQLSGLSQRRRPRILVDRTIADRIGPGVPILWLYTR